MSLTSGETFGAYRIIEQLGRGGMATVYKAYQTSLSRYVAIKVLPAFFAEEEGFRERFRREAIAVAQLRHPNILAVFDYGEAEGVAYIVNEFVDGGTLADQLGKPLPVDYTVRMLSPIASALDYAHSRGVVHRDVKPSNILLARDGTPILGDFGLARMMGSLPRLSHTGTAMGTPEYMAPEQAEGEEAGPAADLYALAIVAYEMLTGRVPFSAATPLAVLLAHVSKPLPLPRIVNPELTLEIEAVLLKGLAKEPSDRYKTASAFIRALAEAEAKPDSQAAARTEILTTPAPSRGGERGTFAAPLPSRAVEAEVPTAPQLAPRATPPVPATSGRRHWIAARWRVAILLGGVTLAAIGILILAPRLEPSVSRPSGVTAGVPPTLESTSEAILAESPVPEAIEPTEAHAPTADEQWRDTSQQLDTLWGNDWAGTINALEAFLKGNPDYAEARAKLYAALVEDGRDKLDQGDTAAGIDQLVKARSINPNGEASTLLLQLTPTPRPAPTRPPTTAPVRPVAFPTPEPPFIEPVVPATATLRAPPVGPAPTATLRAPR